MFMYTNKAVLTFKSRKYDLHFPKVILNVIPLVIHYPAEIGRAGFNDYEEPGQDLYAIRSKRDGHGHRGSQ